MSRYAEYTCNQLQIKWNRAMPDQDGWLISKVYFAYYDLKGRKLHGRKRYIAKYQDRKIVLGHNETQAEYTIQWLKGRDLSRVTRTPAEPIL